MVSALDSGSRGPVLRPGRGHNLRVRLIAGYRGHPVVFLGKTLNSRGASLDPGI